MKKFTTFQLKLSTFLLFALVGLGSFGGLVPKAAAVGFFIYVYSPAQGEYAWTCTGEASLNQATYAPGDTAILSVSGHLGSDNAGATGRGGCSVAYWRNPANTTAAFDLEATGSLVSIGGLSNIRVVDTPDSFSDQVSFTIPPTLTPGSHTVKVYAGVGGGCRINSEFRTCTGSTDAVLSIPFTVVSPPSTGTITATSNIPGASYTITGPATLTGSGTSTTFSNQPVGTYTITWQQVAGYDTPGTAAQTLTNGITRTFYGDYVSNTSCSSFWEVPDVQKGYASTGTCSSANLYVGNCCDAYGAGTDVMCTRTNVPSGFIYNDTNYITCGSPAAPVINVHF